jgi:hypothetical protein
MRVFDYEGTILRLLLSENGWISMPRAFVITATIFRSHSKLVSSSQSSDYVARRKSTLGYNS